MKIVVLDGHTINPGDLSWKPLEMLGAREFHDRTKPDQVYERSKDADIIISSKIVFDRHLLSRLRRLKLIAVIATGYNEIDLVSAREQGVVVSNVPNYATNSVAQLVFALIFEHARHVGGHSAGAKRGKWSRSTDFCYWDYPQIELTGKVLGVVGFGAIGRAVAKGALGFDMRVIAHDVIQRSIPQWHDIDFVSLDSLFAKSDIISLHCPLTQDTRDMINTQTLSLMKRSAYLINTARGPLVNEKDLADALWRGTLAGAGLDVLQAEPPPSDHPLLSAPNCILTPHIGWASRESRQRLIDLTAQNVEAFLAGSPVNVVN
jgi:glycerate dehydrogenase